MEMISSETNPAACGCAARTKARRMLCAGLTALALVFAAGCGSQSVKENKQASQKPLIWPAPPEPARISYLRTIEKPQDIGANKGFFKRLANFILGPSADDIVKPYGMTVDSTGRLILADSALKRVHVFDIAKNKYISIDRAGGDEPLDSPIAAAVDAEDNIYVTDSAAAKVLVYNSRGKFLTGFAAGKRPTGIAINRAGKRIYVTDTASHSIKVLDLKGRETGTIGKWGSGPGEFNFPVDLFIDKEGDLYVADTMNFRIQVFDSNGRFVTMFGRHGDGTGDFGRPKGVAVDRDGHIYVADALFDTIQIFDREGRFLLNFGSLGREPGSFWIPTGVFIDGGDKVYVSDSFNRRVQIFEYLGG